MTTESAGQLRDRAIAAAHRGGEGMSLRQLAAVHGISPSLVHGICRRVGDDWRIPRGWRKAPVDRSGKFLARLNVLRAGRSARLTSAAAGGCVR